MKDREEYISILEQDNVELKKKVDELNRFKFSCKKDETRIPATIYSKKTVEDLIKENQELKKQLEISKMANDKNVDIACELIIKYKNQQQEFIKYLEDEIQKKRGKATTLTSFTRNVVPLQQCLQKYKSIIGVSDGKENYIDYIESDNKK